MSSDELKTLLNTEPKKSALLCARRYHRAHKCINSGAGLLALIWTVVITSSAQFLIQRWNYYSIPNKYVPLYVVSYYILMSFQVVAGFLADVKLGRYVAINGSGFILLFLITTEFFILSVTLAIALVKFNKDYSFLFGVFAVPITIVRVMFIANIIQYGTDQLHDSPADHQSLFVHWWIWACMLGQLIARVISAIDFFHKPLSMTSVVFGSTVLAIFSTVAFFLFLASLYKVKYRKQWFLVDKIRMNPYRSVFNVTKFACKHKTPLRRSAFTYCESEIPSGLDLAKERYGGPYTTEQVEDVKVFYEILKVLLALCPTYFSANAIRDSLPSTQFFPSQFTNTTVLGETIVEYVLSNDFFESLFSVICLSLYLCIIRPALLHYIPGILKRMGIGVILNLLAIILTFISAELGDSNAQVCNFQAEQDTSQSITNNEVVTFTITITILSSLSYMLISITTCELICSQSPCFMKGFLIGLFLTVHGVFSLLAYIMEYIIVLLSFSGCGILYYIINIVIGAFGVLLFINVAKKYKHRKRDDICPVYKYVDDYYSKLVQHK